MKAVFKIFLILSPVKASKLGFLMFCSRLELAAPWKLLVVGFVVWLIDLTECIDSGWKMDMVDHEDAISYIIWATMP